MARIDERRTALQQLKDHELCFTTLAFSILFVVLGSFFIDLGNHTVMGILMIVMGIVGIISNIVYMGVTWGDNKW